MKERPILFSSAMVRAILADLKTQTRRPVKLEKAGCGEGLICRGGRYIEMSADGPVWMPYGGSPRVPCPLDVVQRYCPFGVPGDRLWVREAWRTGKTLDKHSATRIKELHDEAGYQGADGTYPCGPIWYEADGVYRAWGDDDMKDFGGEGRYRHARFMPKWASRITLEVTDVRVERVQSISCEDVLAEGSPIPMREYSDGSISCNGARGWFSESWNAAYPGSWERNDWVWVVSFRRLA